MILILIGVMTIAMDGTGVLMKVKWCLVILMNHSCKRVRMMYIGQTKVITSMLKKKMLGGKLPGVTWTSMLCLDMEEGRESDEEGIKAEEKGKVSGGGISIRCEEVGTSFAFVGKDALPEVEARAEKVKVAGITIKAAGTLCSNGRTAISTGVARTARNQHNC